MKIVLACILVLVLEASVLGSPLKHPLELHDSSKIVGGVEATPHSIPYQVAILLNSIYFCGGVLISTKYVVTVAHCIYGISSIVVVLGKHDFSVVEDTQIIMYEPKTIVHENYTGNDFENDISLIKLHWAISPTTAIRAIQSLASSGNFVGCTGRISGWGSTTSNHPVIQQKLRKVYVEIISNDQCMIGSGVSILPSQMCTLGTDELIGPVGACTGDSGGPLVVKNELAGLISFGHVDCNAGLITGYTSISYFRQWIAQHSGV